MDAETFSRRVYRKAKVVEAAISGDGYLLHKLLTPAFFVLRNAPGSFGIKCEQYYRHVTKKQRSRIALEEFKGVLATIGPDDVCIDFGANVGKFTRRMAETGATVHAFEPDPSAFEALERNVSDLSNVVLHNAAVAAAPGTVRLFRHKDIDSNPARSVGSSIVDVERSEGGEAVEVKAIEVASFIADLRKPVALIKMDIEGAEVDVLNRILESDCIDCIKNIFVETHFNKYPNQTIPISEIRRKFAATKGVNSNFDWL